MLGSGIGRKAAVFGLLIWTVCSQPASADIYEFYEGHRGIVDIPGYSIPSEKLYKVDESPPVAGCLIKNEKFLTVRWDMSSLPSHTVVHSATIQLTGMNGSPAATTIRSFKAGNDVWHQTTSAPGWLYQDSTAGTQWANGSTPVANVGDPSASTYLGDGAWEGYAFKYVFPQDKLYIVNDWITDPSNNNGVRVSSVSNSSVRVYMSDCDNVSFRPTLILDVTIPEPAGLVILSIGAVSLLTKRRRQIRQ